MATTQLRPQRTRLQATAMRTINVPSAGPPEGGLVSAWPHSGGNGIQQMAAAMISCACFWIAARSSGPRKDSA